MPNNCPNKRDGGDREETQINRFRNGNVYIITDTLEIKITTGNCNSYMLIQWKTFEEFDFWAYIIYEN